MDKCHGHLAEMFGRREPNASAVYYGTIVTNDSLVIDRMVPPIQGEAGDDPKSHAEQHTSTCCHAEIRYSTRFRMHRI